MWCSSNALPAVNKGCQVIKCLDFTQSQVKNESVELRTIILHLKLICSNRENSAAKDPWRITRDISVIKEILTTSVPSVLLCSELQSFIATGQN